MQSLSILFSRQRSLRALRRATDARVEIAATEGTCDTLEGSVAYGIGDALVEGLIGERYPVERKRFATLYHPKPPTRLGESGIYTRRPTQVQVVQLEGPEQVPLGPRQSMIMAVAGDWLVRHGEDDYGVVRQDIFAKIYVVKTDVGPANWLWHLLSGLYRVYLWLFLGWRPGRGMQSKSAPPPHPVDSAPGSAQDDEIARLLGNAYRGTGVLIGVTACMVVVLSIVTGIYPKWKGAEPFGALALASLVLLLAGLFALCRVKERWIAARLRAERYRYRKLAALLEFPAAGDGAQLDAEVRFFVGGPGDETELSAGPGVGGNQILYHHTCRHHFEAVLSAAKRVNRACLVISVLCAFASLATAKPEFAALALGTPGIAGALQGVNQFLRLQELVSEHADMAARLQQLRDEFHGAADAPSKRHIAAEILKTLFSDSADWQANTRVAHDIA